MWQYHSYVDRLNKILGNIRSKYMGQEVRFAEVVSGGDRLPPDTLAKHVAQQLTAQLARIDQLSNKELFGCYWWLCSTALYLLLEAAEEDHKLGSLIRRPVAGCLG